MNKRGQITIFIVLGIVVLAILGLVYYFRGSLLADDLSVEEQNRLVSLQIDPVKQQVIDCTKKELTKGVHLVASQGGYYDPVYSESFGGVQVSYACLDDVNRMPLLSYIAQEISQYMQTSEARGNIEQCIDGFSFFKKNGLNIKDDFSKYEVSEPIILDGAIRQDINYPVTLSRGQASSQVKEITYQIDSNLASVYRMAVDVANAECSGQEFNVEDYVWDRRDEGEGVPASFGAGPSNNYYSLSQGGQPIYLKSNGVESDGQPLQFNFIIEAT